MTNPTAATATWLTLATSVVSEWCRSSTASTTKNDDSCKISDASAEDLISVLNSFGADDAPGPASLDPDDGGTDADSISAEIRKVLVEEIDDDQAQMFARRFVSVTKLLLGQDAKQTAASQNNEISAASSVDVNTLLRLTLHRRAMQILSASDDRGPKALRIRALVDFIWSQSLVLGKSAEERSGYPTLIELVKARAGGPSNDANEPSSNDDQSALQYEEFAPGFRHATIAGQTSDFGPVHINVLRISSGCARMRCVDARTVPNAATGTIGCTDLVQLAKQSGALAAISGGFFLYSEPDIDLPSKRTDPVGLLVTDGKIINPPVYRRAALMQDEGSGEISIHRVGMEGMVIRIYAASARLEASNGANAAAHSISEATAPILELRVGEDDVRYATRADAKTVSLEGGEVAISIVGNKVVEVVGYQNPGGRPIADTNNLINIPLAGFVVASKKWYAHVIEDLSTTGKIIAEDLVTYHATTGTADSNDASNSNSDEDTESTMSVKNARMAGTSAAMAGGPILLAYDHDADDALELAAEDFRGSAPPVTFSQDETFDRNLLPRMGVGITKNGEVVMVAIDGLNLDLALGLTLRGTANLLEALGCVKAMNLDGGSSKRMVIRHKTHGHKVVCLSTTEIKAAANKNNTGSARDTANIDDAKVEAVEQVTEDMETHRKKKAEIESNICSDACNSTKDAAPPEPSRPVHSAILFLPPE